MNKRLLPGMQVTTRAGRSRQELSITAVLDETRDVPHVLSEVAGVLRESRAGVVSLDAFGIRAIGKDYRLMLSDAFGRVSWPVTWIEAASHTSTGVGGVQAWALGGVPVEPLELDGRIVGSVFEDDGARYCRLGGLGPADCTQLREEQAREVFERMEAALHQADMDFGDVLRTWFFIDEILSWYGDFNRVRDTFFTERRVSEGVVPASTGVGARNALGAALLGGLLAVRGRSESVRVAAVPSPLQPSAMEYGSSFSRAVELVMPDCRQLFVSGTASIAADGETAHVGNVDAQIALTMDVVEAILESRGMCWADVTRGVAYFRRVEDALVFHRGQSGALQSPGSGRELSSLPVLLTQSVICRDELLFELEIDAVVES